MPDAKPRTQSSDPDGSLYSGPAMSAGLLVRASWTLDRLSPGHIAKALERYSKPEIDHLLTAYAGIDGFAWPNDKGPDFGLYEELLISVTLIDYVLEAYPDQTSQNKLLFVKDYRSRSKVEPPQGFLWCGFDYGYCDAGQGVYSCVLNEVLLGFIADLWTAKPALNEAQLFRHLSDVEAYETLRTGVQQHGADVETGCMTVFGIWKYQPHRL